MRTQTFSAALEPVKIPPREALERLSAKGGMLDDSLFKRAPWSMGPKVGYARLVVHDDNAIYSVKMFDTLRGLDPAVYFTAGKEGYLLSAADKSAGAREPIWSQRIPVRIAAMAATKGRLVTAGAPDVIDPKDPLGAFEGRKGGVLTMFDSASGEKQWEYTLASPPVFNGMAAADGRLYLAMQDGHVACFGE
jgi:outer membrane protein assembly factor BamB